MPRRSSRVNHLLDQVNRSAPWAHKLDEAESNGSPKTKTTRRAAIAVAEKKERLTINPIETRVMEIFVIGTTSLIVNKFSLKSMDEMRAKQEGAAKTKKPPKDPGAIYEACFHVHPDGGAAVFSSAFKGSALDAASQLDDAKKTVLRGAFFVLGDYVRIYGTPRGRSDVVSLQNTKDIRHRPYFEQWAAVLHIEYNPRVLSAEQLVNLMNQAGFSSGIGDWRPASKRNYTGNHGRYRVCERAEIVHIMKQKQSLKSDPKWWKNGVRN